MYLKFLTDQKEILKSGCWIRWVSHNFSHFMSSRFTISQFHDFTNSGFSLQVSILMYACFKKLSKALGVQVISLAISRVHNFPISWFHQFWIFFVGEHFDVCLTNPRDGRKCLCSTELCNLGIQTSPNKNNLATQMFFSLLMLPWLSWNLFLWPFCDYLLIKLYLYYSMYDLKTAEKRKEKKWENIRISLKRNNFISIHATLF